MASYHYQQNERKLRKIVKSITDAKAELEESICVTKKIINTYKLLQLNQLTGHTTTYNKTPVTTYSILQVLRNRWTQQRPTSLAIDRTLDICLGKFNDISLYDYNHQQQLQPKRGFDLFKSPNISLPLLTFTQITNNPPSNQNRSYNNCTQTHYNDLFSSS